MTCSATIVERKGKHEMSVQLASQIKELHCTVQNCTALCNVTYFVILAPFNQLVQQEFIVSVFQDRQHIVRQVPCYGLCAKQDRTGQERRFSERR